MFILYTLPYCPYSAKALEIMQLLYLPHQNIVVKDKDKKKYKKKHGMDTFPQIFIKRGKKMEKVGGFHELSVLLKKCLE